MNFGLNKIDTDIRRKIYESTKDGKVHAKEKIHIYKDSEKYRKNHFKDILDKKSKGKDIVIDVHKDLGKSILIDGEKEESNISGNIIDIRK